MASDVADGFVLPEAWNSPENIQLVSRIIKNICRATEANATLRFRPYEWQKKFFDAGRDNKQRLLMAGNRVGKTIGGSYEYACHTTGVYPDWWTGYRFNRPIKSWALGVTGEQIRDVVQKELVGDFDDNGELSGGMIGRPYIKMASVIRSPQTKYLVKELRVKHVSGGDSVISFKAYSQGQHVLMGAGVDLIWIDEEPTDTDIYPQCVTRTATGGNNKEGGLTILTFTPENGRTELVSQFIDDLQEGQYLLNVTWNDAPHLDEKMKNQLLAAIPEFQREMRSKGIPVLGSGIIYSVKDEDISIDPFQCPDHWLVINSMDFGYDHPQAVVQLWIDPDSEKIYVANAWKKSHCDAIQAWTAVKGWAEGAPVAFPADGWQHEKGTGKVVRNEYADAGFEMLGEHATWAEGGVSVEAGLLRILNQMKDNNFKVFSTLIDVFEEKRLYHRDQKGKIVKTKDDLLDAIRYGVMMKRFAIPYATKKLLKNQREPSFEIESIDEYDPYGQG